MDLVNPVPALEGLMVLFEDGAAKGGTFVDAKLCRASADGIFDAILAIGSLCARMEDAGLLQHHAIQLETDIAPAPGPLTPVARRQLARLAVALDPEGRVVRLPTSGGREAVR